MFTIFSQLLGIKVIEQPGVPGWDPAVKYFRVERRGQGNESLAGLLYRLVSARKQARRRLDGFIIHWQSQRRPTARRLIPAGSYSARSRQTLASHAPRSGDNLPRIRPSLTPHLELGPCEIALRHQRSLDFVELPSQIMEKLVHET